MHYTKTFTKLRINDKTIGERNSVKYLGVTLDKKLMSFGPHIKQTLNRPYATPSKLYPLINRCSKMTINTMIYKTILRLICLCVLEFYLGHAVQKTTDHAEQTPTTSNEIEQIIPIVELYRIAKMSLSKTF